MYFKKRHNLFIKYFLKYENLTDNNQKTFEMYKKQLELIPLNNHQTIIVSGERRKFLIVQILI